MKRLIFIFFLIACIAYGLPSNAQFFKKLGKKVGKAVNSVSEELNGDSTSEGSAVAGHPGREVVGTTADLSTFNPYKLYSLQPGEKFDFKESCLAMHAGLSSAQVVIIKDGDRYLIGKDGQRIPVTDNNVLGCPATYEISSGKMVDFTSYAYSAPNVNKEATENFADLYVHSSNGMSGHAQMQNNMTPEQEKQMEQLGEKMAKQMDSTGEINMADAMKAAQMAKGINRQGNLHYNKDSTGTFIVFNHKRYGPYATVQSMLINKDKNKFIALVTPGEPDMPLIPVSSGSLIITSGGVVKKNTFSVGRLLPYGDFNHYRLIIQETMPELFYNPSTQQSIPIINGDEGSVKIDKKTGAFLQITANKIYIDGKPVKSLTADMNIKPQNIFISGDHKRCAIWTFDGLFLPDGSTIDGVVSCSAQMQDGKNMLNWIVLGKDNKTLILCHEML